MRSIRICVAIETHSQLRWEW